MRLLKTLDGMRIQGVADELLALADAIRAKVIVEAGSGVLNLQCCDNGTCISFGLIKPNDIPKLSVAQNLDKTKYAIAGWNELSHWAMINDVTWSSWANEICNSGYSEVDNLRLLCAALLTEKHRKSLPQTLEYACKATSEPKAFDSTLLGQWEVFRLEI